MADEHDNQQPDEDAPVQPPAHDAPVQPAGHGHEVEAREPEPKTPKSERRKLTDSRFTLITAAISALAGILGAAVGGFFAYASANSQDTAKADADQIATRRTVYSDYLTQEIDLTDSEDAIYDSLASSPGNLDVDAWNKSIQHYDDLHEKALHASFQVELVMSPGVGQALHAIGEQQNGLNNMFVNLTGQVKDHRALDPSAVAKLHDEVVAINTLIGKFVDAAKADMVPPRRGLFS